MAKSSYSPRFGRDIRIKPDVAHAPKTRPCAVKGCEGEGAFRVPKSRDQLSTYIWLCLTHAREHNEKWDYFAGMSESEIERFRDEAVIGHRPTWPLGKRAAGIPGGQGSYHVEDGFAVFGDVDEQHQPHKPVRVLTRLQRQAFDVLNLETSASLNEIKARYKELVKRHHPDANGGDRGSEDRFRDVLQAYRVLKQAGLC